MTTNTASHLEAGHNRTAPVRVGEVVAEKYLIEQTLGVGGMGVVVAARDQLLDRRVAIKFLLPKLAGSETAVHRFTREARAATRITSEHVVRLLEIEKLPSGTPFFVMEYLEGSDLRALLRERGALAPSLAVDYVLQALQAVAEGHVKGIVHRDIKPGNLFLTSRADGTALIKVLDFGIAKTIDGNGAESTSLTSSDDVRLGSPAYMPPEQLQNPRDVDKRSDIWSLGATLYELLCARPPFEGPSYLELASRILSQPPMPLSAQPLPNALPQGLEAILRKCLEKERAARYANAADLAAALAPFGGDDARVSLGRITGIFQSSSSIPALTRSVRGEDSAASMVTLDAPGATPGSSDARSTSNIGAIGAVATNGPSLPVPAPHPGRAWLVVLAAALLIIAVFALQSPPTASSTSPRPREPAAVAPSPAAPPPRRAPFAEPALAEPIAPASVRQVAPSAVERKRLPAESGAGAHATELARVGARTPTAAPETSPSIVAPAPSTPVTPAEAATAPEASSTAGSGRLPEIERLIQERR